MSAVTHASVLRIAIPITLSNVSEPLIGVVNTAVMGRLPEPFYIGAVAVGTLIFGFLFWGFGFLRLSTSGLAAQATGAQDTQEIAVLIWRSVIIACVIGLTLVALGPWLGPLAIALVGGSADVMRETQTYFSYRIWTAPAALCNFAILGWFIGQGRATTAFITQLFLNLLNMVLSVLLVINFGMAMQGVGLAVLIAEYAAVTLGLLLVILRLRDLGVTPQWSAILVKDKFITLIAANADIMIRTFGLVFAFGWFVSRGARADDLTIATNAVLLGLFELSAYMIDGFSYAAETLVGQAIGARDRHNYHRAISLTTVWAGVLGLLCGLTIWFGGAGLLSLMTTNPDVKAYALTFLPWAALAPVLGTLCFQFDGIFTGAMATRDMRNMMLVSLAIYLAGWWWLEPAYGNHGLWAALSLFFVARGVTYAMRMPAVTRGVFA
jgi:multidrug resistance protein, MATE family